MEKSDDGHYGSFERAGSFISLFLFIVSVAVLEREFLFCCMWIKKKNQFHANI